MRAAFYRKVGPANQVLQLGELPDPEPGAGEVRVRVHASGVNPSDVKTRAGAPGRVAGFPTIIPHSDGAGVIDRVGQGIPSSRLGERVWTWNAQWRRPFGTAAEYVVLPAEQAVRLPDAIGFEVGACLGIPALSAHFAVNVDGPVEGKIVLISGGAGAVGHYAIQLAKAAGAHVITTVSSRQKAEEARAAGADHIVNYKVEDVIARIMEISGGSGVDRIIEVDLAANMPIAEACLKYGGTVLVYGSASDMNAPVPVLQLGKQGVILRFMSIYTIPMADRRKGIRELSALLEANRLVHRIGARFSLEQIVKAHESVETGRLLGNVVVDVGC